MILIVIVSIEILAQLTFYVIFMKRYSANKIINYVIKEYEATERRGDFLKQEILHPYVGYVFDYGDEKINFRTQGFPTDNPPLAKREAGKLNIAILGGSVAKELVPYIKKAWERTFKITPHLVNLACPGFKQPQQLMALAYFLSLGAEYDLVINIDGFNDIALPYSENYAYDINPFFPRSWKLRITGNPSHKELSLIGKVKYLRDIKQRELKELSNSIFNFSAFYGLIKMFQLKINDIEIYDSSKSLFAMQLKTTKRFEESGPLEHYENISNLYEAAADVWLRSSWLINNMAKAGGSEYYQFLQPNQYYEGSKRLTWKEKRIAYSANHMYRKPVIIGYPMLVARGKILVKNNVKFFDTTMIFAHIARTIYRDTCCHYNKEGNEILAETIIQKIKENTNLDKLRLETYRKVNSN